MAKKKKSEGKREMRKVEILVDGKKTKVTLQKMTANEILNVEQEGVEKDFSTIEKTKRLLEFAVVSPAKLKCAERLGDLEVTEFNKLTALLKEMHMETPKTDTTKDVRKISSATAKFSDYPLPEGVAYTKEELEESLVNAGARIEEVSLFINVGDSWVASMSNKGFIEKVDWDAKTAKKIWKGNLWIFGVSLEVDNGDYIIVKKQGNEYYYFGKDTVLRTVVS